MVEECEEVGKAVVRMSAARRLAKRLRMREYREEKKPDQQHRVHDFFRRMLDGLDRQDLHFLLHLDSFPEVRAYNDDLRMLIQVDEFVPWPVKWLLARFHKKHSFVGRQMLAQDKVQGALRQWRRKMEWRWWHSQNSTHDDSPLRISGVKTPHCDKMIPCEIRGWLHDVERQIWMGVKMSRSAARRGRKFSNLPEMVRWAFRLMRDRAWQAFPLDKEPGVVLVTRDVADRVHQRTLEGPCYIRVREAADMVQQQLRLEYFSLATRIGKLDGARLTWQISRSMNEPDFWYSSRLLLLCKSHKTPVTWRNVHSSSTSALAGLSAWLTRELQTRLDQFDHILRDSREVVRRIRELPSLEGDDVYMVRIDIKEFYMSGTAETLSELSSKIVEKGPRRALLKDAIQWLLQNQYIVCDRVPDLLFRVVVGSGMGQTHSGPVAESALLGT